MTKTYYHGTSYENAIDIIKKGFGNHNKDTVWNCSNPNCLYVHACDDDTENEQLAIESGQIAAAYYNSQSDKIAVIKLIIPDELEIVMPDYTTGYMQRDSYEIDYDELNKYINKNSIKATIKFYENAYTPYLRPFYLSNLTSEYMSIKDYKLKQATEILKRNSIFIDDLFEYGNCIETVELKKEV